MAGCATSRNGDGGITPLISPLPSFSSTPSPFEKGNATITVRGVTAGALSPAFVGFSYEKDSLGKLFSASDTNLIGLFKRLGPSLLRVGGNSVDTTTWDPAGPGGAAGFTAPSDVDDLAQFLKATGWQVLYGLNLARSTPAAAAAEAAYVARALGRALYAFEIGNEPDLYHLHGVRPANYDVQGYLADFHAFSAAIEAAVPAAEFVGSGAASNLTTFTIPFGQAESGKIKLLSQHYYIGSGRAPTATIAVMLAANPQLVSKLQALAKGAFGHAVNGYRLTEANNYFDGGAPGVSDTFASALWAVDFLMTNAVYGSSGVNFHTGGSGPGYTSIADSKEGIVQVRPEYYGMLFVALAGQGSLSQTNVSAGEMNVTAYAVGSSATTIKSVIIVNKEMSQTLNATVSLPQPAESATLTLLTAPSVWSTSGMTIAGGTVALNGNVSMTPVPLSVQKGIVSVTIPPVSAGLIQVT